MLPQTNQNIRAGLKNNEQSPLFSQQNREIWSALGSYICKEMLNGRGVVIPKFGHFTFNAPELDLMGTTNPHVRDRQIRTPVFMVGKDFVSSLTHPLRTGIIHPNQQNAYLQIRPLELRGVSGVIPKVKANFLEIGSMASTSKENAREVCEIIFNFLADIVNRDGHLQIDLPNLGRLIIRNQICAVTFTSDLIEQTKGVTTRAYTINKVFASDNATLNLKLDDKKDKKKGDLMVSEGAFQWMNKELGISCDNMKKTKYKTPLVGSRVKNSETMLMRPSDSYTNLENHISLTQPRSAHQDITNFYDDQSRTGIKRLRPMSVAPSHTTDMASHMSRLPEADRFSLQHSAHLIFKARQAISNYVLSPSQQITLRDTMSSSQMFGVLKKSGLSIELIGLKQLLLELGFPFNGPSCSLTALMTACKAYLQGGTGKNHAVTGNQPDHQPDFTVLTPRPVLTGDGAVAAQRICELLKDVIYTSKKTMIELFKIGISSQGSGKTVDREGFQKIINEVGAGKIKPEDIDVVWSNITGLKGLLNFDQFESCLASDPTNGINCETQVIRNVRDWMHRNSLSSETAFDALCRSVGKFHDKRLTRPQFHRACTMNEMGMTAARIDSLFTVLCSEANGEVDFNCWSSRIYEDQENPLQMIREIVIQYGLTQDDLMWQMHLKPWDDPIDNQELKVCIRRLDQQMSEKQIFALFKVLKDRSGTIPVSILISNLSGQPFQTVEFRNKTFKRIYQEIYPNNEQKLINELAQRDTGNEGRINSQKLYDSLIKCVQKVSNTDLDRFVRFVETDRGGLINYMDFMTDLQKHGAKNHNPFKSVVNRMSYFLKHNNVSAQELVSRLRASKGSQNSVGVSIAEFANFLKLKVDKKREEAELKRLVSQIDVDKDGLISAADIEACVKNLPNMAFWQGGGAPLFASTFNSKTKNYPKEAKITRDKALEVIAQINQELGRKKITYGQCFDMCDSNKDNMVSYAEFCRGMQSCVTVSLPVLEQIYSLMDKTAIGLITYQQFVEVLKKKSIEKPLVTDNFDWETSTIQKIKEWIAQKQCSVDEAFKLFDQDFDGAVSKEDLRLSLMRHLGLPAETIMNIHLERLFRLLDFFKTGKIQPSDFRRVLQGGLNPYTISSKQNEALTKTLGGTFLNTSTFDWKFGCIQQIGLVLSRKYTTGLKESFHAASDGNEKLNFVAFNYFLDQRQALKGFNLTEPLIKELFSDLDAHKKGYLDLQDWKNAFKAFDSKNQIFVELSDAMTGQFVDFDSAFYFFTSHNDKSGTMSETASSSTGQGNIEKAGFIQSVIAIIGEHSKGQNLERLWSQVTEGNNRLSKNQFRHLFDSLNWQGSQKISNFRNGRSIKSKSAIRPTVKSALPLVQFSASVADLSTRGASSGTRSLKVDSKRNAMQKLCGILKASRQSTDEIFADMDANSNGVISLMEFRNGIRKLGLGMTSLEIDDLLACLDTNGDGKIDYKEFMSYMGISKLGGELRQRVQGKLSRLKELMIFHMTSVNDAFRYFDPDGEGTLAFTDFNRLVTKVHELANEKAPSYAVIKDLFEAVDIRRDGVLDFDEWQQTFGRVVGASSAPKLSMRPSATVMWENSREVARIGFLLAKNRKQLIECFERVCGQRGNTLFSFQEGKRALDDWMQKMSGQTGQTKLNDEHMRCIFRVSQDPSGASTLNGMLYDYVRMLDVYKSRYAGSHT